MYQNLSLFAAAQGRASYAAQTQAVVTKNIANADTPGYRAQSLEPFRLDTTAPRTGLRQTRAQHLAAQGGDLRFTTALRGGEMSPNGNDVSLEQEMVAAVAAKSQHDGALAVYRHGMTVLRTVLGRR